MKEIGERLREARLSMNLEIDEVASDLKLRPSQIENIEDGNMDSFSDVLSLKMFIKEYSKYLGLNYEDMVDEFNEYLFDYTSKVSLSDIQKAKQKLAQEKKNDENKIASPYTMPTNEKKKFLIFIFIVLILLISSVIVFVIVLNKDKGNDDIAFGDDDIVRWNV